MQMEISEVREAQVDIRIFKVFAEALPRDQYTRLLRLIDSRAKFESTARTLMSEKHARELADKIPLICRYAKYIDQSPVDLLSPVIEPITEPVELRKPPRYFYYESSAPDFNDTDVALGGQKAIDEVNNEVKQNAVNQIQAELIESIVAESGNDFKAFLSRSI